MSESDHDQEPEPGPDRDDQEADDEPEPDLSEDDVATIPEEIIEQAEEAGGETPDDGDDQDGDDGDTAGSDDVPTHSPDTRKSVGDVYVRAMGVTGAVARERAGEGLDGDREQVVDEYADLARELELDEYMDDWYAEHMDGDGEMSPGQGLVAMSGMFLAMVALDDPTVVEGALEGVGA